MVSFPCTFSLIGPVLDTLVRAIREIVEDMSKSSLDVKADLCMCEREI